MSTKEKSLGQSGFVPGTNPVCPWDNPGVVQRATGPKSLCLIAFFLPGNRDRGGSNLRNLEGGENFEFPGAPEIPLREAKPGGFQTRGFPTFFGKGPDCVADPVGTVPHRCSFSREREKGRIGKIPGPSPSKSGKSRKNRESPKKKIKKDKKGQKRKDKKVQIGKPPPFGKPPRLAALDSFLQRF